MVKVFRNIGEQQLSPQVDQLRRDLGWSLGGQLAAQELISEQGHGTGVAHG